MDITSEHRDGEITVFVNSATPEVQLTTRREEAKAAVNENDQSIITVAENIESVKDAAKYVDTFDDVIASLPQIMEAATAAQRAEKAEEGATEAKDLSVESAAVASASASSATLSAQKASESETKALASEQSALNSANSASASKTAAQNSALAAAESASSAKQDLASIKADAEMVAEYAPKAIQAAESAENAKASAISAAERAENASQSVGVALEGKQDKLTAGEGIKIEGNVISTEASLPDNVYTETNLLGGKDIEIVKKSGGIDENTIACWHFEGNLIDEVSGLAFNAYHTGSFAEGKFGKYAHSIYGGGPQSDTLLTDQPINGDFTIDCIAVSRSYMGAYTNMTLLAGGDSNYYGLSAFLDMKNGLVSLAHRNADLISVNVEPFSLGSMPHFALQKKGNFGEVFLEGKRVIKYDLTPVLSNLTGKGFKIYGGPTTTGIDETRISKVARYDGDFEPPTVPYEAGSAGSVINFTGQSGKNIGEVYYSQSSLASDNAGALPLFTGETIASANTIYPDFYSWVERHTELQTTAEEYETALSNYGECAKYVVSNGSLRLPKLANYIKMANTIDGITQEEAGLPNITGEQTALAWGSNNGVGKAGTGAFSKTTSTGGAGANTGDAYNSAKVVFDASSSNDIYGNSDTVTPAHTTLYPWVFAFNASVPASTAQAAEFQEGLSGKADTNLGNIPTNYDYVVESYNDGTNWYRVYKSGWVEQGGTDTYGGVKDRTETITLPAPMKTNAYQVLLMGLGTQGALGIRLSAQTDTSFTYVQSSADSNYIGTKMHWYVCGQGAEL